MRSYLDNNATTQPLPEVVAAVAASLSECWANPSSVHRAGIEARRHLELAREEVAALVGVAPREIVFTSGGTESANLAIAGSLAAQPQRRLLVTMRTEHSAVREACEGIAARGGAQVEWLRCGRDGGVELDHLESMLRARAGEIALVSVMWANNETGRIQPVEQVGALCLAHGVRFHCDATQWVGRMPTDLSRMPVDLATFSAHKFHGPKGVGVLVVRPGVRILPQLLGGPQERGLRPGTENMPGMPGISSAARAAREWLAGEGRERQRALRDRLESAILAAVPDAVVHCADAPRLWNTTNIGFPGLEAEAILLLLSERGVAASAGAACSSGSLDPSPVLLAMGVPEALAHGSIRLSLSRLTTEAEIEVAAQVVPECIARLRRSWRGA
jgi:cysteine desulfurase